MRRYLLPAGLLLALAALVAGCGPAPTSSGRGRLDVESGDEQAARPRRKPAPVAVAEFPRLTLEGITLPKPEGEEKAGPPPAEGQKGGEEKGPRQGPQPSAAPPARNLFAVEEDPVVVAERVRQQEEAARKAQEAAKKAEEERKKQEEYLRLHPPPPQPPAIPFTFVGYMGPAEARIGVFAMQGGQLTLAKAGDTLQSKFRVVEVGYESAEIGFQGFTQTQRIPLIGGGK